MSKRGKYRRVVEALVQCWRCDLVAVVKRPNRACRSCGAGVEVLYTVDSRGRRTNEPATRGKGVGP